MFTISDEVRPWLYVQRGGEAQYQQDRAAWEAAYANQLAVTFNMMVPYFPTKLGRFADLGSGLSGIGMMIRTYMQNKCEATLVDGNDKSPVTKGHDGRATYSNRAAAFAFWRDNGHKAPLYLTPDEFRQRAGELPEHDMVISVGSWCFHYAPGVFLEAVKRALRPGGVIITDIRHRQQVWQDDMAKEFKLIAELDVPGAKYKKNVYHHAA